jgi:chaperonin cofactor prefoldin
VKSRRPGAAREKRLVYHPDYSARNAGIGVKNLCIKGCWGATLPAVFGVNRQRSELTGLEEPDELWERLKETMAQATALATANKKLTSRIRLLERRLAEAGGLSDDELVAELPKRMSRALESAQGVATEIVRRARKSEAAIRLKAEESAAAIVRQAEVQAAGILREATAEAGGRVAAAEAHAVDIVRAAHARRDQVVGELEGEATTLRQRIKVLEKSHARLIDAYDVVERTLADARAVLGPERAAPPSIVAARQSPDAAPPAGAATPTVVPEGSARFRVYDWSPASSQAG